MQVDPAIGISGIDKCLGADRELKHPESTGIAVPRRTASRRSAPRRRSPMPSGNLSCRTWTRADGEGHLVKALRAVHVACRQGGRISGHPGASRRSADVRGLRPGADSSLWTCHGPVRLGGCWLRHHPEPHDAGGVGDPPSPPRQCGRAASATVMVMGQGTDAPRRAGDAGQEVRNKARVHRQFGRIDELGDCMEGDYRQVWRQRTRSSRPESRP